MAGRLFDSGGFDISGGLEFQAGCKQVALSSKQVCLIARQVVSCGLEFQAGCFRWP